MSLNNNNLQIAPALLRGLADAMRDDSDISPREFLSAFAEYMQSREPDGTLIWLRAAIELTNRTERNTLPELKRASDLLGQKIYDEAHAQYLRVIGSILGNDFAVPLAQEKDGGVKCEKYMQLSMDDRVHLMACCNGVAKCLAGTDKHAEVGTHSRHTYQGSPDLITHAQALDWFEEVNIIDKNARFTKRPALHGERTCAIH